MDLNLRAAVEKALGVQPGNAIRRSDMERLVAVDVSGSAYDVHELTGLEFAVNLERLNVRGNRISNLGPLADLRRLNRLELDDNNVTDISPLTENESFGVGDQVFLAGNPLSAASMGELIPQLESNGAFVGFRDDHGNAILTATSLALGETPSGGIGSTSDSDYFRFELLLAADVVVFTTGGNTQGDLLTDTGRLLVSDSSSGAFDNFLIREHLQPGRYYVRVTGVRGPYTLHAVGGAPVQFADASLRALVGETLGDAAGDGFSSSELATLTGALNARGAGVRNLDGLEFAVNLTGLNLSRNGHLDDLRQLSSLVSLADVDLERTGVSELTPLLANSGFGPGDRLFLGGSVLSDEALNAAIPALEGRGVFVGRTDAHGDDIDTASPITLGDAVSASIYPAKDRDVFRLRLGASTDVVLYTTGDVDASVVLYDARRRRLGAYDAQEPGNAKISRALDAGDYYVEVRAADEPTRGPYVVHVHEDPNAAILPDLNLRTVVANTLNKPPEAAIRAVDLAAMTSLQAADSSIRSLAGLEHAVNLTHVDLGRNRVVDVEPLSLVRALKELRLEDNRVSDVGPLVMNSGLGHGDLVFLQGNPLSRRANGQVADLIARGVSVVFADDHANQPSGATALALGGNLAASIHRASDQDHFRLTLPGEFTEVAVFTTGEVDLVGTLSDSRGAQLAADDDGGSAGNFLLRATLPAGDYFIKVAGYADAVGTYVVHAIVDEQVEIADTQLLGYIERAYLGSGASVRTGDLAPLQVFDAANSRITDLAGLDAAVSLRHLTLRDNSIDQLSPLSGMTRLAELDLEGNEISDIAALVANTGLGPGDKVILAGNPLSQTALDVHLPALEERGVFVGFGDDHGDRTSTATLLAPGTRAAGALSSVDDEDVFRLELSEATDVAIYTTGPTDTAGRIGGAGSSRVAVDSHGGRGDNFIIRRRLGPGVYYVTVSGSRGFAGIGPYVLQAAIAPTVPPVNITVMRDGSSLVVTWDSVPNDLAGGLITRYRVIATPSDGGEPITCTTSPDARGCTIVGLADGVDYTVTVRAVNAVGLGPVGTVAPPEGTAVGEPLASFWRGWRLSLAAPPEKENVGE
ncbi:MAG: fibronectin type III domain-containing protein [Gammaproteobacteria bacterium]|nr:fibronectin type III domain-containing protein [Gammaproteobacteria bacterium]